MFAVSGWNVSAPLKVQIQPASLPSQTSGQTQNDEGTPSDPSKKRKRGHGKSSGPAVTGQNVAEMWEMVIEGKADRKGQSSDAKTRKKKKKERKRKGEEGAAAPEEPLQPKEPDSNQRQHAHSAESHYKKAKKQKQKESSPPPPPTAPPTIPPAPSPLPPTSAKLTPLQASMRAKLASARFRHLNETLYTKPSAHALALFAESPDMFADYHAGFRQQVAVWPENPVDGYIEAVRRRAAVGLGKKGLRKDGKPESGKSKKGRGKGAGEEGEEDAAPSAREGDDGPKPLPRTHGTCTIADLGCGDARLASALQPLHSALRLRVHSFDLHAASPLVTRADIAAVPLADATVDVAVLCLALMGTNWPDFVDEAFRLLRWKGELWVAEIKSRFGRAAPRGPDARGVPHSVGRRVKGAREGERRAREEEELVRGQVLAVEVDGEARAEGTDVGAFVDALRKRGFLLDADLDAPVDLGNRMFVRMTFVKAVTPVKGKNVPAKKGGEAEAEGKRRRGKGKFIEDGEGDEEVGEAAVLKPCVYKLR